MNPKDFLVGWPATLNPSRQATPRRPLPGPPSSRPRGVDMICPECGRTIYRRCLLCDDGETLDELYGRADDDPYPDPDEPESEDDDE